MKCVVIDARISGTTTGRYVDKLIEYLHKEKPALEIIVLTRKDRKKFIKSIAPSFKVIESNYADFSFGEQIGLARQLYKLKADLVHFPMVQQPIFYLRPKVTSMLDLTTIRFKNPVKNQIVFTIKQKVYYFVNWIAAKKSKHIITISNYVRDELVKIFKIKPERITTTYNSADKISDPAEPIKNLVGKPFIFYTGRPQLHKNLSRLIEAFKLLQESHPDLVLVLGGKKDALYEQIEKDVHDAKIRNVVFTGFISEGELRWLYENTRAYVFPSLSEGFGLPGLEAMVHGAPVVSSNATCLPEIYKEAAIYFDPLNVKDMANKIKRVLDDKKLRDDLIVRGHERTEHFSWTRMAQQTAEIYQKALDK